MSDPLLSNSSSCDGSSSGKTITPSGNRGFLGIVVRIPPERRHQIYQSISDLSVPTRSFYFLVTASTIIAAFGLLANSTAVVIGAMLVAPLMGPIFGTALGLATGDGKLLRRSVASEIQGMLLAVLIGALVGLTPLRLAFGSEILARTQPTLYDVIVALASGLAGAYAMVDAKVSPALPGVAIATALVPPLTTCGLCLADGRWDWALGAFLLFFANFLAIQIVAAGVFSVFGLGAEGPNAGEALPTRLAPALRRLAPSLTLLVGVTVFMTITLVKIVRESQFRQGVEDTLREELRTLTGAQLSTVSIDPTRPGGVQAEVIATVLAPQEVLPAQVERLEQALHKKVPGAYNIHLIVRSLISRDDDRKGPVFVASMENEQHDEVAEQTRFISEATRILTEEVATVPGAQLADLSRGITETTGDEISVTATVRSPVAIEPAEVARMQEVLSTGVGTAVRLTIRSVLTRDANAQEFLYQPAAEVQFFPSTHTVALRNRLETALRNQIRTRVAGASLSELRFREQRNQLLILAVVHTPRSFGPNDVRPIESTLKKYVHPGTQLIVRSKVGADAAATSLLSGFDDKKLDETPSVK